MVLDWFTQQVSQRQHWAARLFPPVCSAGSGCCPAALKVVGGLQASQPQVLPLEHAKAGYKNLCHGSKIVPYSP